MTISPQRKPKSLFTKAWKVPILVRTGLLLKLTVCADDDAGDLLPSPTATKQINGDWVLFHPVYTPDELKAVEVSNY